MKKVTAGSLESNDAMIVLEERPEGTHVEVRSSVYAQFGDQIEATVADMLQQFALDNVSVLVQDRGAYDCTLRARLETAIGRFREVDHA